MLKSSTKKLIDNWKQKDAIRFTKGRAKKSPPPDTKRVKASLNKQRHLNCLQKNNQHTANSYSGSAVEELLFL